MVDSYTRYTMAAFLKNKEAETVAKAFMETWMAVHNKPGRIYSDNGTEFVNSVLKELAQRFSIKLKVTAPYSAWQNGQNERVHNVVDRCLEKFMEIYTSAWIFGI